jgi:5-methylcytosine-specific restriction endonuclease McrA
MAARFKPGVYGLYCGKPECQRERNRLRMRFYLALRRANLRQGDWEHFSYTEIYERDEWTCGLCREPVDRTLRHPEPMSASLDHVVPIAAGGGHTRDNVQCSHLRCNVTKHKRAGWTAVA